MLFGSFLYQLKTLYKCNSHPKGELPKLKMEDFTELSNSRQKNSKIFFRFWIVHNFAKSQPFQLCFFAIMLILLVLHDSTIKIRCYLWKSWCQYFFQKIQIFERAKAKGGSPSKNFNVFLLLTYLKYIFRKSQQVIGSFGVFLRSYGEICGRGEQSAPPRVV